MGGRDAEMTFGIGKVDYSSMLYDWCSSNQLISDTALPRCKCYADDIGSYFHLPSDAAALDELECRCGNTLRVRS